MEVVSLAAGTVILVVLSAVLLVEAMILALEARFSLAVLVAVVAISCLIAATFFLMALLFPLHDVSSCKAALAGGPCVPSADEIPGARHGRHEHGAQPLEKGGGLSR